MMEAMNPLRSLRPFALAASVSAVGRFFNMKYC
jgi:hypothetical protein